MAMSPRKETQRPIMCCQRRYGLLVYSFKSIFFACLLLHYHNGKFSVSSFTGVGRSHCGTLTTSHHRTVSIICELSQSSNRDEDYSQYGMDGAPLSETFQKAVVLQGAGDRSGALDAYKHFLKVAQASEVDPMLYAEVYTNMGAIYAMQGKDSNTGQSQELRTDARSKAKEAFSEAVKYRPGLGSAWVNLALLTLAEGKEMGNDEQSKVKGLLQDARGCCVRALGTDNGDERSRALANKLVGDIDTMIKQMGSK